MSESGLAEINYAQRERLAFIDFSLQFIGRISRAELINHFKTGLASCSRDLTLYRELAPNNLVLRHEDKQYYRTESFSPIFTHNPEAVLTSLCLGFGDGLSHGLTPSLKCIDATRLIHPKSDIVAALMRAINNRRAIKCKYISFTSGETERVIVPHAIANNGHRWHVRAFDRKRKAFRDFVLTRLLEMQEIDKPVPKSQLSDSDAEWNNILELKITPHPSINNSVAISLDYDMVDGELSLNVREALSGYLMRQWNVDCSTDASLKGGQYHLWLSNVTELKHLDCMAIAPGYKDVK
jgi:hypothetical protein